MKIKRNRILALLLVAVFTLSSLAMGDMALADSAEDDRIVVLGRNLSEPQRQQMLRELGVSGDVKTIEVTNEEERKYLGKFIDSKQLGTRAISSAYIERLGEGEGLQVESNNITWVTNDMYRNALVTAGVTDAKVKITSPVQVSGTAALTGIIKAFEDMSGETISELEKEVASEEIAKTATLGNEIGQKEAEELVSSVKMYVVKNGIKNKEDIKDATDKMADELNISLTEEQKEQIASLMDKISKMDLNIDSIKSQVGDIASKLDKIVNSNEEVKNILQRILDSISSFFSRIFG